MKFQETTTGVLSSNKTHFNIIQPNFQFKSVYHLQISSESMTFCVFPCFSFNTDTDSRLPQSCSTAGRGAQEDTRASQSRKQRRMQLEDVRFLMSKTSKRPKIQRWDVGSTVRNQTKQHWWLKIATSSSITSATSDVFFSILNGQMTQLGMARSTSRKRVNHEMMFGG